MNTTRRGFLGTLAAAIGLAPQLEAPPKPLAPRVEPSRKLPLLMCPHCFQETETISGHRPAVERLYSWDSSFDSSWISYEPGPAWTYTREPCGCPISGDDAGALLSCVQDGGAFRR
jgi:hypothetical protein